MRLAWKRITGLALQAFALTIGVALATGGAYAAHTTPIAPNHWVGTWAAAPTAANNGQPAPPASASAAAPAAGGNTPAHRFTPPPVYGTVDATLREIVHVSIGGPQILVVFTNEFGTDPLTIGAAQVAVSQGGSTINTVTASSVSLTFGARTSVTIPPGALVVSDAAKFSLPAESDLAVSFFLPKQNIAQLSQHDRADQASYTAPGNVVAAKTLDSATEIRNWPFIKGVDVMAPAGAASVVTFGDSITDGQYAAANHARWPDELARRLIADKRTSGIGMLNEGIGANRILHDDFGPSALARFDRDVIAQAGVKYLIILEGINDIGHAYDRSRPPYDVVTADDLIAGYVQMVERAHMHGIKVYIATLTPYMGARYESPEGEEVRHTLNKWIRTTKLIDGFIDFDKSMADPAHPDSYLPAFDRGDHLHPSETGLKAMGDSIDLELFTR